MKILLLEDDFSLNEAIKELLEASHYIVDSFYDGLDAYNSISNKYDLYILDINTPSIEGLELLSLIKNVNINTKVLIISALIDMNIIKKSYHLGCDDYIKKPFEIEELLLKIERIKNKKLNKNYFLINNQIKYCLLKKQLLINNQVCKLTKNEKNFIHLLITNTKEIITHEQIEDFVYDGETKSNDAIRSMVKRLRKKIPINLIHNILDEGYKIHLGDNI